jgi:3-hydroxyisobutyrate dehydrogenase
MNIGFLGLGIMGQGMARNLSLKGHDVTAWNRTKKTDLNEKMPNVRLVSTIREAAADREVIMISVTGPDAQKNVYWGTRVFSLMRDPGPWFSISPPRTRCSPANWPRKRRNGA